MRLVRGGDEYAFANLGALTNFRQECRPPGWRPTHHQIRIDKSGWPHHLLGIDLTGVGVFVIRRCCRRQRWFGRCASKFLKRNGRLSRADGRLEP